MASNEDQTAFLREGLKHYPGAKETVDYFQTCVQEAFSRAFEAKKVWRNFQPVRPEFESSRWTASTYMHAYIAGALPKRDVEKAWLSLGLFWNPPLLRRPVVAACHCWIAETDTWVPLRRPRSEGDLALGRFWKGDNGQRLFLELGDDFDPEVSFGLLLDAADDALGPTEDVGSTSAAP